MKPLLALYRKLSLAQQKRWFKIAGSIVAFALVAIVFGTVLTVTYDLDSKRQTLRELLSTENYLNGDPHAVSLHDEGIITVDGTEYGAAVLAQRANVIFDSEGNVIAPDQLVELLLLPERPTWAPTWLVEHPGTTWMLALATLAWLLMIVWMDLTVAFLLTLLGTGLPVLIGTILAANRSWGIEGGFFAKIMPWFLASEGLRLYLSGLGLLIFTFVLLSRTLMAALSRTNQTCAIAHTVIKEAGRLKISLAFIVGLLIILPLFPVWLDADAPLRFRVQTFISRSLGATFAGAALFTIFLSCATVAFEIRDRQIWQLVTKPVSRIQYLAGKWVGVMSLNFVLLIVSGISTFTFVQYLREQPVAAGQAGAEDRRQLEEGILTARVGSLPDYPDLTVDQLRTRIDQEIRNNPEYTNPDEVTPSKRREIAERIHNEFGAYVRSVPPGGQGRSYTFSGLGDAKRLQANLMLRYQFHILRDDEHEVYEAAFEFNGDRNTAIMQRYVPTVTHSLTVPSHYIQDDGTLEVIIYNLYQPPPGSSTGSLNFDPEDLELLYKVGSFEANFLRAMLAIWVKLAFLAMLGIACATFLSFPVACLLSCVIFLAAVLSPFLSLSLDEYQPVPTEFVDWSDIGMVIQWAFESTISAIASALVFLLEPFGTLKSSQALVEGRLISWSSVSRGFLVIGILWSGIGLLIGWMIFRSRQLAIYSGHG